MVSMHTASRDCFMLVAGEKEVAHGRIFLNTGIVYLRPRYLQFRKDEAKRRRREELGLSTFASEGYAGSRESDSKDSGQRQSKTILQTIGDTFRDGAIDDEKELMYVEALEKADTKSSLDFERGDRGRLSSSGESLRKSSSMRSSSAKAESKDLGMETYVERFRDIAPMEEESYHPSESMNDDKDASETLDATQDILAFALSSNAATATETPVVGHSMHFL